MTIKKIFGPLFQVQAEKNSSEMFKEELDRNIY